MENLLILWALTLAALTYFIAQSRSLKANVKTLTYERNELLDKVLIRQGGTPIFTPAKEAPEPESLRPPIAGAKANWLKEERLKSQHDIPEDIKLALQNELA